MKISYDREVDALYIRLKETTVTTDRVEEGIALDYDASDRLAGIEILDARKRLDDQEASNAFASGSTGSADDVGLARSTSPQLSTIQLQVLDALRGVETEKYRLGDWYLGALCALENPYNPDRISQAAQSLRELVEKLPRVVYESDVQTYDFRGMRQGIRKRLVNDKIRYSEVWKDKKIDAKLDKTLRRIDRYLQLNLQPSRKDQIQIAIRNIDPMAGRMGFDIQKRKRDVFHRLWNHLEGFAHHRSSDVDDEERFRKHLVTLEQMVYDLLAPITAQDQDEIQAILNRSEHSEVDAETLYKLISRRGANYVFFFTNTDDPVWIPYLKDHGFFRNPPSAEYSSDGHVQLPFWPELQYLQKVCEHAPQDVLGLALKLPAVDNPRVYADILDIALKLDGKRSAQLKPKMLEYARLEHQFFPFKFPDLLTYWAAEGQTKAALELAKILVQFVPDAKTEDKQNKRRQMEKDETSSVEDDFDLMMTTLRPMPRFNENYREILNEGVRPLAEREPYKVARMLINSTATMIDLGKHEIEVKRDKYSDYSEIWCPRLDKPNGDYPDLDESLVQTLTFACEETFKQRESELIEALDEALRNQRWEVFKRLRQHLYSLNPIVQTLPWMRELILEHRDYGRWEHHYEFQRMIRSACEHFGAQLLTEDERSQIFDAILSGPPEEDFREWLGDRFTETEFEKRRKYFHRQQLRPFASVLFGKCADYFQQLEAEEKTNEITDESYQPYKESEGGWVNTRSPRSTQDLAKLSDEKLLEYINNWEDEYWDRDDQLTEINIEALAGAFQKASKESIIPIASRFSFWIENRDKILRPIYVRAMINAMQEIVKAKDYDNLEESFAFCNWVLSHPDSENWETVRIGRMGDGSREFPRWHTSRRAVCDFVEACIEEDVDVPIMAREHLAGLLEKLCTQDDWRLDNEKPVLLNRDDQLTEAINTTRGRALDNLVKFGYWVRDHEDNAEVPEIKQTLEKRVSTDAAFSLTLPEYAILGMRFGSLFHFDEQWTKSRKSRLFPRNDPPAWREAFGNFLRYNRPYRPIFDELQGEYEFALEHLDCLKQKEWTGRNSANDYLGQHLFTYYLWGVFPLNGSESLLDRVYLKTEGERKHWATLFRYVGHSLRNTGKDLEKGIRGRILAFFDWRLEVGEPTELQEFVFWLEAQSLEGDWVLNAYSRILDLLQKLNWDLWRNQAAQLPSHAIHSMREMLPEHTPVAVECLGKLIDSMPTGDTILIPTDDAKAILNAGRDYDDETVREKSDEIRENMLKRGFLSVLD